jgi:hypothetical protein
MAKLMTKKEKLVMFSGLQFLLGEEFGIYDFLAPEEFMALTEAFNSEFEGTDDFVDEIERLAKKLAALILQGDVQ